VGLFDVHAHLTHPRMVPVRDEVLARARAAGVTTIVSNGLNPADNQAVADLAAEQPMVKPAFGLYPVDAVLPAMLAAGEDYPRDDPAPPADPRQAVDWVAEHVHDAFAVGEIGLDHYWVPEPFWADQEARFRELVEIAMGADKAVICHSRKAEARMFEVLVQMGATRVDWHCFGSKLKLAKRIAAHGHWLSVPANAVRSEQFRRLLETLPRDKVLLETDCPYLSPVRDESSEPSHVAGTAALAAELWGCSEEAAHDQLEHNFEALFGVRP
jgi:TatD DNase family protein